MVTTIGDIRAAEGQSVGSDEFLADLARFLRERSGLKQLITYEPDHSGARLSSSRLTFGASTLDWINARLCGGQALSRLEIGRAALETSVVSADLRHLSDPGGEVARLAPLLERAPLGVLGVGPGDGPRVRRLFAERAISIPFEGGDRSLQPGCLLITEPSGYGWSSIRSPTAPFDVVAFVIVYNEEDILEAAITDLDEQGVSTYVIDNWSTDRSYEIAASMRSQGVVGVERYPERPPEYFDLRSLLERIEVLAGRLDADWYMKHDADEFRRPPWSGVSLRDGLFTVQSGGFNCVDFTVLNFEPVDDGFQAGMNPLEYFRYYDFGRKPGHFRQLKAWRNTGEPIEYATMGSHRIRFPGLRIFPYKFLLRHYPVRSQSHGERKVFHERKARFLPEARRKGWHSHYDAIRRGHSFVRDPADLLEWDEMDFERRFLAQRLTGIGIERKPA